MNQAWVAFLIFALSATNAIGDEKFKQYLNIKAPETALNAPIIFTRNGKTTLVGLYIRNGKRDVSAMQHNGTDWKPLGDNGNGITGVDGNFLTDVAIDGKGNPWMLAYYTRPSNAGRADRFYLYTLRDNHWTMVGPKNGLQAEHNGGGSLVLLNGELPVLFYRTWDSDTNSERHRCFVLRNDQWSESPLGKEIPRDATVMTHKSRAWVIHAENQRVTVHPIEDLESTEMPQPRFVIDLPKNSQFGRLYLEDARPPVIQIYDAEVQSVLLRCNENNGKLTTQELPMPDDHTIIGMNWTRDQALLVATSDLTTARVYRLNQDATWKRLASQKEASGAILNSASFTILGNGTPIVTWEAFFPH